MLRMIRMVKYLGIGLLFLSSCDHAVLFTTPQPFQGDLGGAIPANYRGCFCMETNGRLRDTFPDVVITDSVVHLNDFKNHSIHKNFVDGLSYQLKDSFLWRDGVQISAYPVSFKDDYYHYVSNEEPLFIYPGRTETPVPVKDTILIMQMELRQGLGYLVFNCGVQDDDFAGWVTLVIKVSGDVLSIERPKKFEDIQGKTIAEFEHTKIEEERYLLTVDTMQEFEQVRKKLFVSDMYLRRCPD